MTKVATTKHFNTTLKLTTTTMRKLATKLNCKNEKKKKFTSIL
jgi:hypothetical protein